MPIAYITIQREFLDKQINEKINLFNGCYPYLIMNSTTFELFGSALDSKKLCQKDGIIKQYHGCTVLIDESLKTGEIDIR